MTDRTSATDVTAAREEAVSFAYYRMLESRFATSPGAATITSAIQLQMTTLGYDFTNTSTVGDSAAAVGNRIAAAYIAWGATDGSNQSGNYADTSGYVPANAPLVVADSGTTMTDPNRWQPLTVVNAAGVSATQRFLTPHWGDVTPFAATRAPGGVHGGALATAPPVFGTPEFKANVLEVLRFSGALDPNSGDTIDISPGASGNNTLGTNDGVGHAINPVTGVAYATNVVPLGDYGRVLSEFWADGPQSETPPGHWNAIANEVSANPLVGRQIGGVGASVDDLEWSVKLHFALNGAVHDAAITAWDLKEEVDYVRPISMIRYMATQGQSSDSSLPSYDPDGLPLEAGVVELVTDASSAPGERHEGLTPGTIAVFAWNGHDAIDPVTGVAGAGWIDGKDWLPYQSETFVTPGFAAFTSGHSTFSRAAAEVLAAFTGDEYFPGGIGEFEFDANNYLTFEDGPSQDITLQWATYFDAADEAGISRLYGGIHVTPDDLVGRVTGSAAGIAAYGLASRYFDGSIAVPEPGSIALGLASLLTVARRQRA